MPKWAAPRRVFVALVLVMLLPSAGAFASTTNPYTGAGADVSYPQCSSLPAQGPGTFAIIGATGGKAFTSNTCLAQEVRWASEFGVPTSFYMNLNYPVGSTASQGMSGKYGSCQHSDKLCQALNYGYNAATYAANQARAAGATINAPWWLDIETANSWSAQANLNADVIQGALAYFADQSITAGVYSTSSMWTKIAGTYSPAVPNWVVAAAGASCLTPIYAGASVWVVQNSSGASGGDQACP
jgi:hypothetical protein